jgi:hypothetical protein
MPLEHRGKTLYYPFELPGVLRGNVSEEELTRIVEEANAVQRRLNLGAQNFPGKHKPKRYPLFGPDGSFDTYYEEGGKLHGGPNPLE